MSETHSPAPTGHEHVFLGDNHQRNERRTWFVIALTAGMMVAEIAAGTFYGSMALVADGYLTGRASVPPPVHAASTTVKAPSAAAVLRILIECSSLTPPRKRDIDCRVGYSSVKPLLLLVFAWISIRTRPDVPPSRARQR